MPNPAQPTDEAQPLAEAPQIAQIDPQSHELQASQPAVNGVQD